jgi:hypothetical protein
MAAICEAIGLFKDNGAIDFNGERPGKVRLCHSVLHGLGELLKVGLHGKVSSVCTLREA